MICTVPLILSSAAENSHEHTRQPRSCTAPAVISNLHSNHLFEPHLPVSHGALSPCCLKQDIRIATNVNMLADPISPIAPARVRVLLLPAGRIKRSRFSAFVKRLQSESAIRLGDVTPDARPDRSEIIATVPKDIQDKVLTSRAQPCSPP